MTAHVSNLERDGQLRPFAAHGHATLGSAGGVSVMRGVFEPGWRWSVDMAPTVGVATCPVRHLGYVLSGRMHVRMDDGEEMEMGPGDLFDLPAGHDAWVLGDEPCVMVDVSSQANAYGRGREAGLADADDRYMTLVRRGYAAFNTGDVDTLRTLLSPDVVQHVPGTSEVAGSHKGIDAVLGYYGRLAELTDGTFRAHLVDVFGDGHGHVTALHQTTATRAGVTRVARGTILFTFLGDRATDLLEMHEDVPADDAFLA